MPNPFVWFDNASAGRSETATFLGAVFGWEQQDLGPMTMQVDGENGPFAGVCDPFDGISGWVPYVEVEDLTDAARRAEDAGAQIIAANKVGPAGDATFIKDPGGSVMALWKRKAGV